jgi:glycosyltransferase involved in cell wall biosynthesis
MFVYPSLYEGFGFPPLEAMYAGCPAIVSRTSALPEICGDAAFYFDPNNDEELALLIDSMSSDAAFRTSKREAGFTQVRRYSWAKTAAATLAAYQTALDRRA